MTTTQRDHITGINQLLILSVLNRRGHLRACDIYRQVLTGPPANAFRTLKRMESSGYIAAFNLESLNGPDQSGPRVYRISKRGEAELKRVMGLLEKGKTE